MNSLASFAGRAAQWWVVVLILAVGSPLGVAFQWRSSELARAAANELERLETDDPAAHERLAAADLRVLDGRFSYSAAEVDAFLEGIGETGRKLYWLGQLCFDVLYPLLYCALFLLLFTIAWRKWNAKRPVPGAGVPPRWFLVLVLACLSADLLENACTLAFTAPGPPASPLLVRASSAATSAKWSLVAVTSVLVALFWAWQCAVGTAKGCALVVRHVFLSRVPLLVAIALLVIPTFADSLPTIGNLLIMRSATDLAVVAFLAVLLGAVAGYSIVLVWDLAHIRFDAPALPLTAVLRERGAVRAWPFTTFAVPLIASVVYASTAPPDGDLSFVLAALAALVGVASATGLGRAIDVVRVKLTTWEAARVARGGQSWGGLARRLGPGYFDEGTGTIERGHVMSLAAILVVGGLYFAGFHLLRERPEAIPALAYVLVLLLALSLTLSGMAFFLDRYRVPLVLAVVVYSLVLSNIPHRDHFFEVRPIPEGSRAPIGAAVKARSDLHRRTPGARGTNVLTVVCASGGGIQAAGWTARVLTGLQDSLGPDFTRSIQMLSTTSGGSVGAYHFLNAFDASAGAPPASVLEGVVAAGTASSLEATAWGLAYPDFMRAFLPVPVAATLDRAWAAERAWLRQGAAVAAQLGRSTGDAPTLLDWMEGARDGSLPGVVFNATFVEDAQQFLATNLDLSVLRSEDRAIPADPGLERHYPYAPFDMDAVTAARLSATFPWVTPVARALPRDGHDSRYHVADGGYFDNYGTVVTAAWLRHVLEDPDAAERFERLLIVEIRAFPPAHDPAGRDDARADDDESVSTGSGWVSATLGPFIAIMGVRTSTQIVRSELEMELLRELYGARIEIRPLVIRPPWTPPGSRPDPPLSWHLSRSDKQRIENDWTAVEAQALATVGDWFE